MRKNSVFFGLMLVVVAVLYSSCEETSYIGFPVGEQKIKTIFLDTFTIKTSTILLDSITTSASGRILVGEYHDAVFGKTKASSFFQLGTQNAYSWSPTASAVFDSIGLILKYDKYYYGDTTQTQSLVVNELSEYITTKTFPPIDAENFSYFYTGLLFNNGTTKSFPAILGSINYKPRPLSDTAVFIRLNEAKGKEWLEIAKGADKSQIAYESFLELFKGVKVSTSTSSNAAVVGFSAATAVMRIYYSELDTEGALIRKYFDFPMYNPNLQYNQVITDRTGTPLQNLVAGTPVSSELTNNETFIQGGAGVLTKIEFPNFKYLTSDNDKFMILSARLVIIPVISGDGQKKMPLNLGLLVPSTTNVPSQPMVSDFDGNSVQNSTLLEDKEFNKTTQYSFSLIQYIDNLVNKRINVSSLILSMPLSTFPKSVDQLRIGNGINQNSKIKLEIYLSRLN